MGEPRSSVEITPATLADVDAVHAIEQASFPSPWRREFFAAEIVGESRYNLVARVDGVVIGYLFGMQIFEELHVNKIAVEESHRRQGIADALMQRCFAYARTHDVTSISLEVRASNHSAQAFYRGLEFENAYVRKRYYPDGESAVVMEREIE